MKVQPQEILWFVGVYSGFCTVLRFELLVTLSHSYGNISKTRSLEGRQHTLRVMLTLQEVFPERLPLEMLRKTAPASNLNIRIDAEKSTGFIYIRRHKFSRISLF